MLRCHDITICSLRTLETLESLSPLWTLISIPKGMPSPAGQDYISTVQQLKQPLKDKTAKFGSSAIKRSMSVSGNEQFSRGEKCLFRRKPWDK